MLGVLFLLMLRLLLEEGRGIDCRLFLLSFRGVIIVLEFVGLMFSEHSSSPVGVLEVEASALEDCESG